MALSTATLSAPVLDGFRRSFGGDVIRPADPSYDEARRLWNAIHDRRPALILRPSNAAEVATAIRFGREQDLAIAVRSGGHAATALAGRDGGLVIDLSAMRGVEVDAERRTARTNGGALLGELDVAAQAHGLVCPVGVVGHTGVAGLTLGGGVGRLQRRFGLTIDNLTAVELVTADGRLVRASETEEPDLFWGLRGAGWNFGIATALEFGLQPFGPDLHRGVLVYEPGAVRDVWEAFGAYARTAPDAVSVIFGIDRARPDAGHPPELAGRPIVTIAWNHSGAADDVEGDTMARLGGPKPIATTIGSQPYPEVQTAHDLVLGWGRRASIMSCNVLDLDSSVFDELVELVATAPGEATFSATALGGAIARVPDDATAYLGRGAAFDVSGDTSWDDPALDDANRAWTRRVIDLVRPEPTLGGYSNGTAEAGPDETRAIYGETKLARLVALKRAWDPDNVFRVNHNVAP
jgi:FAD/FMN-containing dehydrogenase